MTAVRPGLGGVRATGRSWAHLLLGGAVFMPPFLLASVVVGTALRADLTDPRTQFAAYALALPVVAAIGSLAPVRPLSAAAAQALLEVPADRLSSASGQSAAARRRSAGWLVLHTATGALVGALSLTVPPAVVVMLLLPFVGDAGRDWPWTKVFEAAPPVLAPLAGMLLGVALPILAILAGKLLRGVAPVLLGPTPADRLLEAERRAERLAESNRIARELHDSVGHALSAVTLQASAARRVLDRDPEFVRRALAAVEETGRRAVEELDSVLGVLREGADGRRSPGLEALGSLLESTAAAGVELTVRGDPHPAGLTAEVSREAYRIVQEGLNNVLRHAGPAPTTLELHADSEELTITMDNELPGPARGGRPTGGRGLTGVAERARLLGGSAESAPYGDGWRLTARLPLGGRP
ncbi:histidine kinase [Streptomyces sp. XM4193]|uniref:sensor histidine kinase n=1 Tax=Streptomyces sp. XM4193 TaxID=2929782 RepID=UPI001FFBAD0D|nr:histidine kinase [Streptomyces sp. XM4193]MCK1796504.1 histidine kinase [Streptomyces sp. XM4193]